MMNKKLLATALIMALPTVGHAEKWEKGVTLYGWVPGLDTTIATPRGNFSSSPSGSDVLSDLDMVFMGTFEVGKGRWRFIKDIIYVDLSDTQSTPFGTLFSSGTTEIKAWAVSGYVSYRVFESSTATYEIAGGVRYFDLDTTVKLSQGVLPPESSKLDANWIDPVIGVRGNWKFSDKWSATAVADLGGFSGSSQTWQVLGTLNYNFNDKWAGRFGYRHMDISKTIDGSDVDVGLSGPIFGVTYRF